MQRPALRNDAAAIAGDLRIDPMVIDVAVEDLFPKPRYRKTQIITPPGAFSEGRYNYNVVSDAFRASDEKQARDRGPSSKMGWPYHRVTPAGLLAAGSDPV